MSRHEGHRFKSTSRDKQAKCFKNRYNHGKGVVYSSITRCTERIGSDVIHGSPGAARLGGMRNTLEGESQEGDT
jgi:hypothetical protein